MLQAIRATVQQQTSKLVLWVLVGVCMLLLARMATRYLWSYNSLIATTSATTSANALLQTFVERYNRSHVLSKLSLSATSPLQDSPSESRREPPDFAVIAPGTPIPTGFAVIASLNAEKVILLSHKGNHFEQLREISNAAIHLVTMHAYDEGVLRKLFDFFEIPDQRNTITTISVDQFLASKIVPNRVVYALFINPHGLRSWDRPRYAFRGGLSGAGASSTDAKIAANIERGFCPKKRSAAVVPSGRVRKKL